jgi:hypothetical protein
LDDPQQTPESNNPASPPANTSLRVTLLPAAWLAILLGFAMEALLLLFAAGFGIFPSLEPLAADLVRQVSWSTFVCVGLALGTAVSKARAPLMGLLGVLAAPLALGISRNLHQGAVKALEIAGSSSFTPPLLLLALLKAAEYGCLGVALGWIEKRPWGGLMAYVATGLIVGLVFGGVIVALTYWKAPEPLTGAELVSRSVNEILFPVGCSLVLFSATVVGKRVAS